MIRKLISIAPRRSRAALLQNLILSGESVDIEFVRNGLAELLEAAKTQRWILSDSGGYELKEWLRLLPFTNRPLDAVAVVCNLPADQRRPVQLEGMIAAFGIAPGDDAEDALFQLAEAEPNFYKNRVWRDAAIRRGTLSAATRFVDLAATGVFSSENGTDRWNISTILGGLIGEHAALRAHVYDLIKYATMSTARALLMGAVVENPDTNGLLILVKSEIAHKCNVTSWRAIESVVTKHVPTGANVYEVVPAPAVELRRQLLAMTTDGGPTDAAARCLNQIDKIRDESGLPDEPRHPDLASGKAWPIMML